MTNATPTIEGADAPYGIRITDPIESVRFTLLTAGPVDPVPAATGDFAFPVDAAASVSVTEIETPYLVNVLVRDDGMNLVARWTNDGSLDLEAGEYYVEISSAKVKLYLRVRGGVAVEPRNERVHLSFPGAEYVTVGARSFHDRPAATISTTGAPEDVASALSHLGSALKTTSPERSFPTLRGHPPLLERGEDLAVPDALEPPETDVTIEVPPRLDALFPVAPLAYYFGATVETGQDPVLIADGEPIPLAPDGEFERTASRILRQAFLLDCVTRTEGYYRVDLHERRLVESAVDLDFAALYERPLARRLRSYLDVPYEAIADAVPTWKLTADVVADPSHLAALPFLADELAVVRCPPEVDLEARSLEDATPEVRSFFDTARGLVRGPGGDARGQYRSRSDATPENRLVFEPPAADSIEQTYLGPGVPLGASKITVDQLHRRLDVQPTASERIRVAVVCNDPAMADENAVEDVYGTREWIEFDIATHEGLTTDELADLFREDVDFLHYIGHVDDEGIRCPDGHLDARTLTDVDVGAFLLNACQSYEQGRALVDAGALGGVVTLTEILDRTATEIGRTVARLLNQGFSLLSMLDLLEAANPLAQRYMVVGDGNVTLVESESGTPISATVERVGPDEFEVEIVGYPATNYHLGTLLTPYIDDGDVSYLNSGTTDAFRVSRSTLHDFLKKQSVPVRFDGELRWSAELTGGDLGPG